MPPERATIWAPALAIAATVALSIGLAAYVLLDVGVRRSTPFLFGATQTGASAVGQAVAGQFAHALALGIPLDKLQGIQPYLQRISDSSPQVEELALIDSAGRTIAATAENIEGLKFPISGGGARATLLVSVESPLIEEAVRRVRIALAIAALLSGVLAGGIMAFFIALYRNPAQHRLSDDMQRVAAGDFTITPSTDRGYLAEASRTLALSIEKVKAARRHLIEAVATIRAIDFDGSLGRRVDAIVHPIVERYSFSDHLDAKAVAEASAVGVAWRAALFFGLYAAAFPYLANFAMDRESDLIGTAWIPVTPLLAELAAAAFGASIGSTRAVRGGPALAVGCLILGGSLIATYWCREFDLFVALRALAGFSAGLAGAGFLFHRLGVRRLDLAVLLVFSALLIAPLVAGLYAEAIGRRSGFLVLGVAVLIAMPLIAIGTGRKLSRHAPAHEPAPVNRADLLLGLATVPVSTMVLMTLPGGLALSDYLASTGAAALLAACALLMPKVSPAVCGLALFAAALILAYPLSDPAWSVFAACAAIGLATGGMLRSTINEAARPWYAIGAGTAAALALTGAVAQFGLPLAGITAGAALLIIAVNLLGGRHAAAKPA